MRTMFGSYPYSHWIVDDFYDDPDILRAAYEVTPDKDWPSWVHYNNECEFRKRTSNKEIRALSFWNDVLLYLTSDTIFSERIDDLPYLNTGALVNDPYMYGSGCHVTDPGGYLQTHLDYAQHPKTPHYERRLNLVLFLNPEWKKEWGGHLEMYDDMGAQLECSIEPRFNRAVIWEASDLAFHAGGLVSLDAPPRVTATAYYLGAARPNATRKRALYVPRR